MYNKILQTKIYKFATFAFICLGLIGFFDAAYLVIEHFRGVPITCSVFSGCEKVTTSRYATIGPVPVALLGLIYYMIIFLGIIAFINTGRREIIYALSWFTTIGFLASAWFIYLQLFVIKAICPYCVISAVTSTALFIIGVYIITINKKIYGTKK